MDIKKETLNGVKWSATGKYSNLVQFDTFKDRFNYLSLKGVPAEETFGFDRYLNQQFYQSREWKKIREEVILRDLGCDLAMYGFDIVGKIIVHHMNLFLTL